MRLYSDYPDGTLIRCLMVGGPGHGKLYARSPADAHQFLMHKSPPVAKIIREYSFEEELGARIEVIRYEPIAEIFNPDGFLRLFADIETTHYRNEDTSVLQIADAMRIAGINFL